MRMVKNTLNNIDRRVILKQKCWICTILEILIPLYAYSNSVQYSSSLNRNTLLYHIKKQADILISKNQALQILYHVCVALIISYSGNDKVLNSSKHNMQAISQ